jgi:DNA-binding NarL/FixJ family response regulator
MVRSVLTGMPGQTDVVLVDGHEALSEGLSVLLEQRGITTIGAAGTVAGALDVLRERSPDVAVLAVNLPDGSGLRLARRLRCEHPSLAIMIYTGIEDVATLAEAVESGARGFVLKLGGIAQFVRALRLVASGQRYVDPAIRALLDAKVGGRPLLLTRREREVFDLLAEGMTGAEIATRLTVVAETVRTHIRNGMDKLDAHTRTGAVVQALRTHEIATV